MTMIPTPAAQYLRMSTDHQQYSLQNQAEAIERYAKDKNFVVVHTYCDAAKTGMILRNRSGLKQLLQDVVAATPPIYRAILVYDVSRWGRFQDTDESAHYEFLCKSAGIPVHYCAEPFANDSSLSSLIMKALKRTMAGEYSRELGVKILAGQNRLVRMGFKQGGIPGYGMRRMLVSADRSPKQLLANGERKSIASDRVILVPGPEHEVSVIRDIFRMLVLDKMSVCAIAKELNKRGVRYTGLSTWDYVAVYNILTHPKYMGCNTFGRTSQRLYTRVVRRPPSEWTTSPGAFEPIIDENTFSEAQHILESRTSRKSNERLLDELKKLLLLKGRLSASIITSCQGMASPSAYNHRFGSLKKAYGLIGYTAHNPGPTALHGRTRVMRNALARQLTEMFPKLVKVVKRRSWRPYLRLKNRTKVSILVVRLEKSRRRDYTWVVQPAPHECKYVALIGRLDNTNSGFFDFHVFPSINRRKRFVVTDGWLRTGERLNNLSEFYQAALRARQQRK